MNKNKTPIYLLFVAIISFIFASVIGFIYFKLPLEHGILRFILSLQNGISAFAFSPTVEIKDFFNEMMEQSEQITAFEWGMMYAYTIALLAAQFCTATAIFVAFKTLFVKAWEGIKGIFGTKEEIIVFGYNEKVQILIDNLDEGKIMRLVTDKTFDDAKQLELAKKHVIWIDIDILKANEKQIIKLKKKISKADNVILFEESEMRNFSIYSLFCTNEHLKALDLKCYIYCEDDGIREVIEQYYTNAVDRAKLDKEKSDKEKVNTENGKIPETFIFSLAEIKVNKIFKNLDNLKWIPNEMTEQDYVANDSMFNIHLLIAGFGKTGQQMLMQTLNQGVLHSRSKIWIDIVDRNALLIDDLFMKRFHEGYVKKTEGYINEKESSLGRCSTYTIDGDGCDGELKIRFFEADIRGKKFQKILDEVIKSKDKNNKEECFPLTNIMVGFHELDTLASCIMDLEKHALRIKYPDTIKMVVCADISVTLLDYLKENNLMGVQQSKVEIIDTISNKNEICVENIFNTVQEERAKSYCYIYNKIYAQLNNSYVFKALNEKQKKTAIDKNWSSQSYEDKMSNYALSYHQDIKAKIVQSVWKNQASEKRDEYVGKNGKILQYKNDNFKHETQTFLESLAKHPFMEEMVRLEHRRWNYFKASQGWRYAERRDNDNKVHNCLCSYEKLRNDDIVKAKIVYDLIPVLYEYEEDLKNKKI